MPGSEVPGSPPLRPGGSDDGRRRAALDTNGHGRLHREMKPIKQRRAGRPRGDSLSTEPSSGGGITAAALLVGPESLVCWEVQGTWGVGDVEGRCFVVGDGGCCLCRGELC